MELMTLRQGLILIEEHNLCPVEICIDLEKIINWLTKENLLYNPIIHDCRYLIRILGNPIIHHSYREQNKVADTMANVGAKISF